MFNLCGNEIDVVEQRTRLTGEIPNDTFFVKTSHGYDAKEEQMIRCFPDDIAPYSVRVSSLTIQRLRTGRPEPDASATYSTQVF